MSWRPRWLRDSHTPPQRREDKTGAARRLAKTVSAIRRRSMKSPPEVGREKVRLSTVRVLAGFGIFDPSQEAPGAGLIRAVSCQFRSLRPALRISMSIIDHTPVQTCGHRILVGFDETCDDADARESPWTLTLGSSPTPSQAISAFTAWSNASRRSAETGSASPTAKALALPPRSCTPVPRGSSRG
jgi:hypothetical protein